MKQYIIINSNVKMTRGKTASQAAHASVDAVLISNPNIISEWHGAGMPKIVLKATEEQILETFKVLAKNCVVCSVIKDAGKTQVDPGTITAMAIGPIKDNPIVDVMMMKFNLL